MEVCRACLTSNKNMMPFNKTFIDCYNMLTSLNIKPLDGLPQCACETCVKAVNYFIDFREQCIQSESSLQQNLLESIKLEVKECEENQVQEDSIQSSSEILCNKHPRNASSPKRPRGRPRKTAAASETQKQRRGRPRKNKANIPEVENLMKPLLELEIYSNSEEFSVSQLNQTYDLGLDIENEDIKYEYEYLDDNSLTDSILNLDSDTSVNESLVKEDEPEGPETLKTTKKYVVNESDFPHEQPKKIKTSTKSSVITKTAFPCGLCEKCFETQQAVSSHLENHKNESKCETCLDTFAEWPALLAHRIEHVHSKYHQCHICLKRLQSIETLEYHYLSKHSDKNLQDIKMSCKLCTKTFSTAVKLKKHMGTAHANKQYICDHCNKTFSLRNCLKVHLRQHSKMKKYVCDTCGFSSNQNSNLQVHIWRMHTATRANCSRCGRVFPDAEALQRHKCSGGEKICPVCGKMYIRSDHLLRHTVSESKVGKYKCELCPAVFTQRANLVTHVNRHGDVRPHACPHCPKRFYAQAHLQKHLRIHTGVRPYVCKSCSKAFNTNYNLKIHMRVHGEYLVAHRYKQDDPNKANAKPTDY